MITPPGCFRFSSSVYRSLSRPAWNSQICVMYIPGVCLYSVKTMASPVMCWLTPESSSRTSSFMVLTAIARGAWPVSANSACCCVPLFPADPPCFFLGQRAARCFAFPHTTANFFAPELLFCPLMLYSSSSYSCHDFSFHNLHNPRFRLRLQFPALRGYVPRLTTELADLLLLSASPVDATNATASERSLCACILSKICKKTLIVISPIGCIHRCPAFDFQPHTAVTVRR